MGFSRSAVVDFTCVYRHCAVKGARKKRKKIKRKKTNARSIELSATPRFAPLWTPPLAHCSLRRGIMHLAARRVPFRVTPLSRALVLLPPDTLLIVGKKVSSAKCAVQPARVAHGRNTCVRVQTYRPLLDRRSCFHRCFWDKFRLSHCGVIN